MRQKAAWECELKPVVPQQSFTDGTYLAGVQNRARDLFQSLPRNSKKKIGYTPQPDLSVGINVQALISVLSSENQNFSIPKARKLIQFIQKQKVQHKRDGPFEPVCRLVPALHAPDLSFTFAVIEGKT
ncbi:hypothetical protein MMC15_000990 [Xylographa vitiligo]|nr:hypothetical protein [Xylographa vitiligo]